MNQCVYSFNKINKANVIKKLSFSIKENDSYGFVIEDDTIRNIFSSLVCGMEYPDEGTIKIHNKDAYFDGYPYPELGVLLNEPSFINTHDGFKNLKFLSEFTSDVENIQITKVMNFVGLDPLSETKVCNYSCAMYKKLCLAYALIPNTRILVINEPFKHLNQYALKDFQEMYAKLRTRNTMIYISKTHEYLPELCDKLYTWQNHEFVVDYAK